MNIIFLDIDGVLCTIRSHVAYGNGTMMYEWDPTGCEMLIKICQKYNCQIVCSSCWRHDKEDFIKQMTKYRLIPFLHSDWKTGETKTQRGFEIKEWLDKHPEVETYVILDDDRDMLEEQINNFVFIEDPHVGIEYKAYLRICKIFESNVAKTVIL